MSFANAIRVATRAAAAVAGQKLKLQRGAVTTDPINCGLGTSQFETLSADGAIVLVRSRDFLILTELYDFGDGPVEPVRGDKIIRTEDDGDHTYELLDLPNQPSWRWSDPYKQRIRVHTKEVAKPS